MHLLQRPARLNTHCRRRCALSEGGGLAERFILGQEIGSNHWPKKASFRRFPANLPRKLWPGFTGGSSARDALGSGPPDSCCTLAETSPFWRDAQSGDSPDPTSGPRDSEVNHFKSLITKDL